ncbi:haloalkane dehalogenase [Streptacidiphilus sp. N1-10]|uniref:Haloalkane dehalogenase n=1 Tax=Streptacidiphilus jeojiensis TaxID=3229225 RepID=A0ABV6Y0M9_9ACTN
MASIEVLDSFMNYRDTDTDTGAGTGAGTAQGTVPVVFLHGNPTSSYLWRNVIPQVVGEARCLAPDLIGMGESGKPELGYRLADHVRYLDAWFEALGLDEVVIVGHDWGGTLGMDWAARHPGRVRGVAVVETFLRPMQWEEMPPQGAELFRGFRSPKGEETILENNLFIEFNLPRGVAGGLAPSDHDVYRAPFLEPASRRPILAWTRELPLGGEPADVVAVVERYRRWMADSPEVPKLLMAVDNGVGLGSPEMIAQAAADFASAEVVSVGPGGHHIPEDQPEAIGTAVADWIRRHALTAATAGTAGAASAASAASTAGTASTKETTMAP